MKKIFEKSVIVSLNEHFALLGYKKLIVVDLVSFEVLYESNHVFKKANEQICALRFSPDARFFLVLSFSGKVALFEMEGTKPVLRFSDNDVENCYTNEGAVIFFDDSNQSFIVSIEDKKQFCTRLKRYSTQGSLLEETSFNCLLRPLLFCPSKINSPLILGTEIDRGSFETSNSKTLLYKIDSSKGLSLTPLWSVLSDTTSDIHYFQKYLPIHFLSDTDYIGYCVDPQVNRQGFYRVDIVSTTVVFLLDISHLANRYDDIRLIRYNPQTESAFLVAEKIDLNAAIVQKVQILKCNLPHQTISYLALIEKAKPVIAVNLIDCNEKYTVFTNTHKQSVEFIENGVSKAFQNGSLRKYWWLRPKQWGVRNIIHLALFAVYLVALLAKLIFVGSDQTWPIGLLCVSASVAFFFTRNLKFFLRAGDDLVIDFLTLIAIVALILY